MKKIIAAIFLSALIGCGSGSNSVVPNAQADTPGIPQVAGNYVCSGNCGIDSNGNIVSSEENTGCEPAISFIISQNNTTVSIFTNQFICTGTITISGAYAPTCYLAGDGVSSFTGTGNFSNDTFSLLLVLPADTQRTNCQPSTFTRY